MPRQDTWHDEPESVWNSSMWQQTLITLRPRPRGSHLVAEKILDALPELWRCRVGLLHLFLQHTSASLTLDENADPTVCRDFERLFEWLAPRGEVSYEHNDEGPDGLPAHFKANLLGCQLTLSIQSGGLALDTWQGIYLDKHRDRGGVRCMLAIWQGESVQIFPSDAH